MRTKRNPRRSRGTKKHRNRSHRYVQRGGWNLGNIIAKFPFGQDLVNVGRSAGHGINDIYRGVKGVHKGVGPFPTQNQLTRRAGGKSGSGGGNGKPMDMASIYKKNKQSVKGI
jgi:hypothetical protein